MNNKEIVLTAMTELFVKRDISAVTRYWSKDCREHNPITPDGNTSLSNLVANLGSNFCYEPGRITADGDCVMLHGRYTGRGPRPLVAVDIFRMENGKVVEHWDVMQEEIPAKATCNGRSMFTLEERR